MLHPKLKQALKDTQRRLFDEGKLLTVDQLKGYYAAFRTRFNIERLRSMDGETLLNTMHEMSKTNPDSLVYWLEFKNDDELPTRYFGSIKGGTSLKFGIYKNHSTDLWMAGKDGARNKPSEITLDKAIEIARTHRDELSRGMVLLENLPVGASDEAYAVLQGAIDEQMPIVGRTAWGHKYLSLFFPEKLDDYHSTSYQHFHLVKLLEPNIPEDIEKRYLAAGRFVRIAQELELPMNNLTTLLNEAHGIPYRYWSILASDSRHGESYGWETQRDGGFAAIAWDALGDLSELKRDRESKRLLSEKIAAQYPHSRFTDDQDIFDFVTGMKIGDVVVAFDRQSGKGIGIGVIINDYDYDLLEQGHRRPVRWYETIPYDFPIDEGFDAVTKEIRKYDNQVEIERYLLGALRIIPPLSSTDEGDEQPKGYEVAQLTGLPGRIQSILERKGQVILYGPPGTGKTYWAELSACELSARQVFGKPFSDLTPDQQQGIFGTADSTVQLCSFHPAYGYEDFLEGYRPQLLSGQMTFVRQNGIFKQLCKRAREDANNNYYLIIDEINRGDIPRIFGELLTLLEKDKRGKSIMLPLSGEPFAVPANVFVIGTMNTADRSIALLDTALRRRFGFVELLPDPSQLGSVILKGIPLRAWLKQLNDRILDHVGRDARNLQIGHAYFLEGGQPLKDFAKFARILREDIIPLLEEYCYEDYEALEKILGSSLVDKHRQIIRQDLFEAGREEELAEALLQPTPDLTTDEAVIAAEVEAEAALADVDVDDAEDNA